MITDYQQWERYGKGIGVMFLADVQELTDYLMLAWQGTESCLYTLTEDHFGYFEVRRHDLSSFHKIARQPSRIRYIYIGVNVDSKIGVARYFPDTSEDFNNIALVNGFHRIELSSDYDIPIVEVSMVNKVWNDTQSEGVEHVFFEATFKRFKQILKKNLICPSAATDYMGNNPFKDNHIKFTKVALKAYHEGKKCERKPWLD